MKRWVFTPRHVVDCLWEIAAFAQVSGLILYFMLALAPWWVLVPAVLFAHDAWSPGYAQELDRSAIGRALERHEAKIDRVIEDVQRLSTDVAVVKRDLAAGSKPKSEGTSTGDLLQLLVAAGVIGLGGERIVASRRNGKATG